MEYLSWWPAKSSWMSPGAALFLFCNVLVGAILVTSRRGEQGGRAASTRRLCRSASSMVLDRLRSFSMFSGHPVPAEERYHMSLELESEDQQQPQLAAVAEPAIPTAPASAPVAAAGSAMAANKTSEGTKELADVGNDKPVSSNEAQGPAWQGHAQQSSSLSPAVIAAAEATAAAERPGTVAESIMQRARACRREVEEALEGKAALNARAEVFIRQFREDLKLQRLNSIINYTRGLRRGAGGAPTAAQ
ncbi:hypothetical protein BAE44_0012489 [Dichanthelium oligosanthes]|uniref:DUF4408 domain-containing protein n=1 Tax=Dichanthelium oligosanthes TaxID=888268 RepID=A0A1E5VN39_9POAL|nr:hypothetical protein BAE44_0012489 [Dichanthelium oligosanthes]